jgi:hypothetical protein
MRKLTVLTLTTGALLTAMTLPGAAQSAATVTAADYTRAEQYLGYNTTPLVSNGPVQANWLPDDRFWYRTVTATGSEFVLVDAVRATKAPAFNHAAVAAALTTAMGKPIAAGRLPFTQITLAADGQSFWFESDLKRWTCDLQGTACTSADRPARLANSVMSPDGKLAAFIRDYNLWVRDVATGTDKQLTPTA